MLVKTGLVSVFSAKMCVRVMRGGEEDKDGGGRGQRWWGARTKLEEQGPASLPQIFFKAARRCVCPQLTGGWPLPIPKCGTQGRVAVPLGGVRGAERRAAGGGRHTQAH